MSHIESAGFIGSLSLKAINARGSNELWSLNEDLSFIDSNKRIFTAPKGMVTDLASIPGALKSAFSDIDHRPAGAIHDALYLFAPEYGLSRAQCDTLFVEMCRRLGAGSTLQWMAGKGLQLGGWHSWDECRRLGVRWGDFDTSQLSANEIASYRGRFNLDRFSSRNVRG